MKHIIYLLLMLPVFYLSCADDTPGEDQDDDTNGKGMIDEQILGKWKVEYSKTIDGARFLDDGTLEIAEDATTTEYMGNFGEPDILPKSGIFDRREFKIDIKKDNSIEVYIAGDNNKTIHYKIEKGLLISISETLSQEHKYKIENKKLTIERIPTPKNRYFYTISEYSKITE